MKGRYKLPANTEQVPSKFARSLLRLVAKRGYDTRKILANADIPFDPAETESPQYQENITVLQYSKLYQLVLSVLQDESFGFQPGKGVTPGAFRMMCYCIIHCETLGRAMNRATQFFRIFYEESFQLLLRREEEWTLMGYAIDEEPGAKKIVKAEDAYGLSAWHRFASWLIGRPLVLEEVHFSGLAPENYPKYEELFGCPLRFAQGHNALRFQSRHLELPVIQTEQSLKEFLRSAPYQLMVVPGGTESGGLVTQVKSLMGQDFSKGFPSFERISQALNMSAPTLRRRLKREGTNYQQLKDDCRKQAAVAYLSRPELSINAVAALMGFTDPSAFHRSFKKWTGIPPGLFRQRQFARGDAIGPGAGND